MPCHDPRRSSHDLAAVLNVDDVPIGETQTLGHRGRDEHDVVPGQLGERLGELLEPPVVCVSAVVDGRIRPEDDLGSLGGGRRGTGGRLQRHLLGGEGCARDDPVIQHDAPAMLEIRGVQSALPVALDEIVRRRVGLTVENRDKLLRRPSPVQRIDQRLQDGLSPVECPSVTP